ncbi:MAG: DUF362 domain-containing protein [Halobacteriota archaeon]|nr:DUF362 domain-containing protein [Halobacteriota archaeon]
MNPTKRTMGVDKMKEGVLKETPFSYNRSLPPVFVASGDGPYENTKKALAKIDLSPVKGKSILLKPNAGRVAAPESGVTTNPQVIAAAIDVFIEAGATVAVGESPITGFKTMDAFEATGIASVARDRNCQLIDMDVRDPIHWAIKDGIAIKSIEVCSEVLEYDVIVSIPVMKTHIHTVVTLSVKNMKGCLWRRTKVDLHMLPKIEGHDERPLNMAIADLSTVLLPHLSIIDGNFGMEGMGPSAGKVKKLNLVVAGFDPFATDAVSCSLMGFDVNDVPHLRMGANRGGGVIDLSKIQVTPSSWYELASPFEPPPENLSIEFPGVTVLDEMSCSACQYSLLMFLKRFGDSITDCFPGQEKVNIAIGKGHESVPLGTLCIGNCTVEHKRRGIYVPGCPPVASQILKKVSEDEKTKDRK